MASGQAPPEKASRTQCPILRDLNPEDSTYHRAQRLLAVLELEFKISHRLWLHDFGYIGGLCKPRYKLNLGPIAGRDKLRVTLLI